jgi:hypothetical protein
MAYHLYTKLFNLSSPLRRRAGETQSATHIVYDINWQVDQGPNAVVPHYFEVPIFKEDAVLEHVVQCYEEGHLLCVDEKASTVFRPILDVDGLDYGLDKGDVAAFVRRLIVFVYKNCFKPHKNDRRWTRQVLVWTSNPKHKMTGQNYNGNEDNCEAYFTRVKKGFGLHIAFVEEKVLRQQYKGLTQFIKTKFEHPFANLVDGFDTQINSDNLMKLRMPLCDNGRKGFPQKPYVLMANYQVKVDMDEDSFAVEDLGFIDNSDALPLSTLRLKVKETNSDPLANPRRRNNLCFIQEGKYFTSVFKEDFDIWFASNFTADFVSVRRRLTRSCLPLTGMRQGYISLDACPSDLYAATSTIEDKLKIQNALISDRISRDQSIAGIDTAPVINECIDLLNEVVFYNVAKQRYFYISKNCNLNRVELIESDKSPNFGLDVEVYILVDSIERVKRFANGSERVDFSAPPGFHTTDNLGKAWKKVPFLKLWREKGHMIVSDVIFDPSVAVGNGKKVQAAREENRVVINTFPGFKVSVDVLKDRYRIAKESPTAMKRLKAFRNFIRYVLLGGNIPEDMLEEESLRYLEAFEKYYKQLIVKPHERTNVIMTIKGSEQGYGKTWIPEDFINKMYGEHSPLAITTGDTSYIFGNFTHPDLDKTLLVYIDEGSVNKDEKEQQKLKQMTTGKTTTMNVKKAVQYNTELFFNTIATANDNAVVVKRGDRRILCFSTWNLGFKHPKVIKYFSDYNTNKLYNVIDPYRSFCSQEGVYDLWLAYLASDETYPELLEDGFRLQSKMPMTFSYQEALTHFFDPYATYWYNSIMRRDCSPHKAQSLTDSSMAILTQSQLQIKYQKRMLKTSEEVNRYHKDNLTNNVETDKRNWNNLSEIDKIKFDDFKEYQKASTSERLWSYLHPPSYAKKYYEEELSPEEREGYKAFLVKDLVSRGEAVDSITDQQAFEFFVDIYNEQNALWPRELPVEVVQEEMKMRSGSKRMFRFHLPKITETLSINMGLNTADYQAKVVTTSYFEVLDWLTCLKQFALKNRLSSNYVRHICNISSNNSSKGEAKIAPWPDGLSRFTATFADPEDREAYTNTQGGEEEAGGRRPGHEEVQSLPDDFDQSFFNSPPGEDDERPWGEEDSQEY